MTITEKMINLNISNFGDILNQLNTNTDGMFWVAIYWLVIIILFLSTIGFGFEAGVILSLFVGVLLGIFLTTAGLLNQTYYGISLALLLILIIHLIYKASRR